jgi:tetratricopeptide (TPR) repeat protein
VAPRDEVAVDGYEILGELGRGGMGIVYKAQQAGLKRLVALKMIQPQTQVSVNQLERFRKEAEAVARMQHPHIVQIYELGEQEGRPYFSLEFMEGGSLDKKLAGKPQPAREAAELLEIVARAVHYAHRHGIVHRDLKPANVLLTADGTPKITDFGLAKQLDAEVGHTPSGVIVGTPSYMAPEQAQGYTHVIGPLSDVYGLGALLYELLTGRPPFQGPTVQETLEQVWRQELVPPRRLQPGVPRDLETICLKCLQKEPAKRYANAEAMADDLRRFRKGEPIRARPVTAWERFWKWAKRRPAAAALATVSGLAGVSLLAMSLAFNAHLQRINNQLQDAVDRAEQKTREADEQRAEAEKQKQAAQKNAEQARQQKEAAEQKAREADEQRAEAEKQKGMAKKNEEQARGHEVVANQERQQAVRAKKLAQNRTDHLLEWFRKNMFDIDDQLSSNGVSLDVRGFLLESMRDYLNRLRKDFDEDHEFLTILAVAHSRVGNVLLQMNRLQAAWDYYQESTAILKSVKAPPGYRYVLLNLSGNEAMFGEILAAQGRFEAALVRCKNSLEIRKRMNREHPDEPWPKDYLARSHLQIGDILAMQNQYDKALASYKDNLALRKTLAEGKPSDAKAQRQLAIGYERIGKAQEQLRQLQEALASFEECQKIYKKLADANPRDDGAQRDLAVRYEKIGRIQAALSLTEKARDSYREGCKIVEKQAKAKPDDPVAQRKYAEACNVLGHTNRNLGQEKKRPTSERLERWREAKDCFEKAHKIWDAEAKRGRSIPSDVLNQLDDLVKGCEKEIIALEKQEPLPNESPAREKPQGPTP